VVKNGADLPDQAKQRPGEQRIRVDARSPFFTWFS